MGVLWRGRGQKTGREKRGRQKLKRETGNREKEKMKTLEGWKDAVVMVLRGDRGVRGRGEGVREVSGRV